MKPEVTLKYLSYIRNKKNGEEGFTLIELLVVVIIIGVLAAVALPNLLGQVGKARETEAKNGIGSVNRAQQAYHFEKATFSENFDGPAAGAGALQANNALGIIIPPSKYYDFTMTSAASPTLAQLTAVGVNVASAPDNGKSQGTRDFIGAVDFVAATGAYDNIICQADTSGTPTISVMAAGALACTAPGDSQIQ